MKKLVLFFCITISFVASAQHQKLNFALKTAIEQQADKTALFPLFVIGNTSLIRQEVIKLGGVVKRSSGNAIQIELPVNKIAQFSNNTFVQSIPYAFANGKPLNDTMVIHNNVEPIYNGNPPLFQSYTGKGVLFGLIDTGHDIVHPDFRDSLGNTRILRIWDQTLPDNGTSTFGYGVVWDSTSINNSSCTHIDYSGTSHGTHVSGIAVGNGLAVNKFRGVAPEASIVAVASNFSSANWLSTVVDAVDYIFQMADSLNMPCVINASIGDYFGSHDGTDPAALLIDSLVNYKPGRAFVCAGGNAGFFNWHIEQNVTSDTSFSWFEYNPSSILGYGSVFYEVWADTADFNNVNYAFGANLPSGSFDERGTTPYFNIQNRLGNFTDTIKNGAYTIAIVETYGELQDDKYLLQVLLNEPDSNAYYFSFKSTGSGKFDTWSTSILGTSDIVETGLPTIVQYPPIAFYTLPDSLKTTVSSFNCSPNIITVANFVNRKTYIDYDSNVVVRPWTPGSKGTSSSLGPDRRGNIKPDIGATGDVTLGPNAANVIAAALAAGPAAREKVAFGGFHRTNGGTSMASPVVAGTVALYLEKCPTATMSEIKNAILTTAKQDTFTGAVPNPVFGYGKINAFAALNTSNYSYALGGNQSICDGDSVQLTASGYNSYWWSINDTNSSVFIDTTQSVFVQLTNNSGCIGFSDTINIVWHVLPTKPVLSMLGNDTLIYSTTLGLQWYFNTNALTGETDTIHIAQNDGDYYVQVTDGFGCKNNSDTVSIIGLGIESIDNNDFTIYPNPVVDKLYVSLNNNNINSIILINTLGDVLLKIKTQSTLKKYTLDLSSYSSGLYFVNINTPEQTYQQKLILLR